MRRRAALLGALVLASAAGAQDLGAYRRLAAALDAAPSARASSAQAALDRLDAAEAALDQLRPTLQNRQLSAGLSDALGAARGALARTPAELQAQVLLARGLMRKALYDQTLTRLVDAPAGSGNALTLLGQEFGLGSAAQGALRTDAGAGRLERVAWRLQRTAVQKVDAALGATAPQRTPEAYLSLARATSWFTAVQDAADQRGPRLPEFGAALRQLTAGDTAALATSLAALRQGTARLGAALAEPPTATPAARPTGVAAQRPAPAAPRPSARPAATPTPPTAGDVGALYAALGRAQAAAGHGDLPGARAELTRAAAALSALDAELRGAPGYTELVFGLTAAQERRGLRAGEVGTLIAQTARLEAAARGEAQSTLDQLSAGAARHFSGWPRALLFLVLALLAGAPLYLLSLAFGLRNAYWRAIAGGLLLLLLPLMAEGLLGLLGLLGDLLGVGALRTLGTLTLTQGPLTLPLWALGSALAIGALIYGFRGLCQQFGLLGAAAPAPGAAGGQLEWDEDL